MDTAAGVLIDFGLMSLLLVVAHLLRANSRHLQDFYLPTPVIAGVLALLGGRQVLGVLWPSIGRWFDLVTENEALWVPTLPFSQTPTATPIMSVYPSELVALLFATLLMGARHQSADASGNVRRAGSTFFYNLSIEVGQFGIALLFGLLILTPLFPYLNPGFAIMLPAGFVGGHASATVVGEVLRENGWEEALTIGYTFATIGLLVGIIGGILLINLATRRGWTRLVKTAHELPRSVRRGFLAVGERRSMGQETVSPIALDPLTWHVALVFTAFVLAHLLSNAIRALAPGNYSIPLFALSMLVGAGLQKALEVADLGHTVDRGVMGRIGSSVSDYLIAFGIASIRIDIVVDYAVPIVVMVGFGIIYALAFLWFIGRRIFHDFWFERSIFSYGWSTGVVAIGVTLLRVVDPKLRSRTLEDYGLAYVLISIAEILVLIVVPPLVAGEVIVAPAIVLIAVAILCIVASRSRVGWYGNSPTALRPGERQVIERNGEQQ